MAMTVKDIRNLNWDEWLYNLAKAAISGGASAVAAGFVAMEFAPETFNTGELVTILKFMGTVFFLNAVVNAIAYLKTKPLPEVQGGEQPKGTLS
jgi:hypothetical protein